MLAKNKNLQGKEMGEDMSEIYGEKGTLVFCWNANWCSHCAKQYGGSSKS